MAEVGRKITLRVSWSRDAHAPSSGASADAESSGHTGVFRQPVHELNHRLRLAVRVQTGVHSSVLSRVRRLPIAQCATSRLRCIADIHGRQPVRSDLLDGTTTLSRTLLLAYPETQQYLPQNRAPRKPICPAHSRANVESSSVKVASSLASLVFWNPRPIVLTYFLVACALQISLVPLTTGYLSDLYGRRLDFGVGTRWSKPCGE